MPANRKTNDSILLTRPSVQFCPLIFIFLNPSNKLTYFKDARQLRHGHFVSTMERKHKHISPEQITSSGTSSEEQAVEERRKCARQLFHGPAVTLKLTQIPLAVLNASVRRWWG